MKFKNFVTRRLARLNPIKWVCWRQNLTGPVRMTKSGGLARITKLGGFSLIEMLVSIFIFSLMVGTISGLFITGIQGQRSILSQQKLIDETSFAMEYMSRALRMAVRGGGDCAGGAGDNYSPSGNTITFQNILELDTGGSPECQTFSVIDGELIKSVLGAGDIELTSDKIIVEDLNFVVSIDIPGQQPKVTISMRVKGAGPRPEQQSLINLQTTVSQRNLNE